MMGEADHQGNGHPDEDSQFLMASAPGHDQRPQHAEHHDGQRGIAVVRGDLVVKSSDASGRERLMIDCTIQKLATNIPSFRDGARSATRCAPP